MRPRGHSRAHRSSARRLVMAITGLALTLGALPAVTGAAPGTNTAIARADDVMASQNALRDGWDPNEPAMGPSVVPTFTQLFDTTVNGQVYAQPLVLGSTVFVTTENDWVYGLDATTGKVIWSTHLGSPWDIAKSGTKKLAKCTDLTPNIGITGTPVYDPGNGNVYFFANVVTGGKAKYYLYGVNPGTGAVVLKTVIAGHPSNDQNIYLTPSHQGERAGALLLDGWVYGSFASHCDVQPYAGYVAGVNVTTGATTLWTDESGVTYNQAGIWQGGGGLMSDGPGRLFLTSGNGVSPAAGPGSSPHGQLAESVIRLALGSNNTLSAQDFFSPADAPSLDASDTDFGAGGPVAIPFGTSTYPDILAQAGKDGRIFLLNRDNLGGREQGSGGTDDALSVTKAFGGEWGHPAVFGDTALTSADAGSTPTDNDFLFYAGKNDVMRVFRFGDNGSDKPDLNDVAGTSLTYPFTSGSPVVTSNGDDPTTAVVWEVHAGQTSGAGSEIDAYALGNLISTGGTPSPCTRSAPCQLKSIWHEAIPEDATKFTIPATSNGRVYIGTRGTGTSGQVIGYGAPPASAAPVQAATTTMPQTGVSSTSSKDVSVTAKSAVTISSVAASTTASNALVPANQYATGQVTVTPAGSTTPHPVTLPATLGKGARLQVQVKFTPAAPGAANGALSVTTSTGKVRRIPLTGSGVRTGLYALPSTLTFPFAPDQGLIAVPAGIQVVQQVDVINSGTTPDRVSSVTPPSGPFTATALPTPGQTIQPGQALVVQVTFAPQQAGPASSSFTITDSNGKRITVPLSGIGTASVSRVTASQTTVNFGSVQVGQAVRKIIHITNTGNIPTTVSVPEVPRAPFHSRYHVFAGLPFNPGYDLKIPVIFTPTRTGTFTEPYVFHWKDRLGEHSLTVTLTGMGV